MEKETTVNVVKKDKTGFKGIDEQWYSNKFKKFEVSKGDKVRAYLNDKGFLENVEILQKSNLPSKNESIESASLRKEASMALAYAKDLAVAGKISVEEIGSKAKGFMNLMTELAESKDEVKKPVKKAEEPTQRPDLSDVNEEDLI